MATSIVSTQHLSPATRERIASCGHPLWFVRPDGESRGHWRCGNSWCSHCADRRRVHVFHCVRRKLDVGHYQLVTLTVPKRSSTLDAESLRAQSQLVSAMWRGTQTRLRWYARTGSPEYVMPPSRRGKRNVAWSETWKRGNWLARATSGTWVREVTASRSGWHVHLHVIVRTRAEAELLNAAWQRETATLGCGWTKTDIRAITGVGGAAYVSNYLAKKDLEKIHPRHHGEYVRGVRHMRRCDAWGTMRPLGIRRVASGTVTHVRRDAWKHPVPIATYYGATHIGRLLRSVDDSIATRTAQELVVAWLHARDSDVAESVWGGKTGRLFTDGNRMLSECC